MIPYYTIPFMTEQALHDDPLYKLLQGADEEKKKEMQQPWAEWALNEQESVFNVDCWFMLFGKKVRVGLDTIRV